MWFHVPKGGYSPGVKVGRVKKNDNVADVDKLLSQWSAKCAYAQLNTVHTYTAMPRSLGEVR